MKITVQTLIDMKTCEPAVKMAREKLPKAGLTQAQFIKSIPQGDWLIWYLWNAKLATIEQIVMAGCCAGRRGLRFSGPHLAVNTAAFDAADVVVDSNTEENRAAAARSAAWSAAGAASAEASAEAESAWSAAGAAEHLACANDIRKLMKTERWGKAGLARTKDELEARFDSQWKETIEQGKNIREWRDYATRERLAKEKAESLLAKAVEALEYFCECDCDGAHELPRNTDGRGLTLAQKALALIAGGKEK